MARTLGHVGEGKTLKILLPVPESTAVDILNVDEIAGLSIFCLGSDFRRFHGNKENAESGFYIEIEKKFKFFHSLKKISVRPFLTN